ncbi:MAG: RNA methyltransferase [Clostridia bacterium]|nr:RNA methyltransferase [Clostridia bacterium]
MIYSSKQNKLIKSVYSLKDKKGRISQGLYVVEGFKMVLEAISAGAPIERIFGTEEALSKLNANGYEIVTVSPEVFSYISSEVTPQGVLATVKVPKTKAVAPTKNALVLDGVSDPGNMGTIIRTACAFGFNDIYLVNCTDPYAPKAVRASMSGIYFVNLYKVDYEGLFSALSGYDILSLDMGGEDIASVKVSKKFALVVGNEANGLSSEITAKTSKFISIPMREHSESLNAGVAVSIAMYKLSN